VTPAASVAAAQLTFPTEQVSVPSSSCSAKGLQGARVTVIAHLPPGASPSLAASPCVAQLARRARLRHSSRAAMPTAAAVANAVTTLMPVLLRARACHNMIPPAPAPVIAIVPNVTSAPVSLILRQTTVPRATRPPAAARREYLHRRRQHHACGQRSCPNPARTCAQLRSGAVANCVMGHGGPGNCPSAVCEDCVTGQPCQ